MCVFLMGGFGIHRFMVGKVGTGIFMLIFFLSLVGILISGI
ncbi:TM2 domain-containing membrane protein YozV [Bartonella silvatica]|uniref:TM2 domain-containing membrane protein YozV n=1 Tax=Bartonella silvatica TaxID=357760 RepID=A0ABV2HHI3_9HYPH